MCDASSNKKPSTRSVGGFLSRQDCQPSLRSANFYRIELTQTQCMPNFGCPAGSFFSRLYEYTRNARKKEPSQLSLQGFVVSPRMSSNILKQDILEILKSKSFNRY